MAKHPAPGRVKTRLAATIGDDVAAALCRAFIRDLDERLRAVPFGVTWAFWPPDAAFERLVPAARCRPQDGADLGARMANAIAAELADGAVRILVIGADVPHVGLGVLLEARDALAGGADVVLGPACDGGYYLIGARAVHGALFDGMRWGAPDVCAVTRARAAAAGLHVHLLPETFDVDDLADVRRLKALVEAGGVALPETAGVLAGLGHGPV